MNPSEDKPSKEVFSLYQKMIKNQLGIMLPPQKRTMLGHRLLKRLRFHQLDTFKQYYNLIQTNSREQTIAFELVTTNETFFFREEKHFDYLRDHILPATNKNQIFNVWCGAASTGEEPYSIAMVLDDKLTQPWRLLATDVNQAVIDKGKKGIYVDQRTELLPKKYLKKYCRKGIEEFSGYFRIESHLREKVNFETLNLLSPFTSNEKYDVIFLRNVMIYFDEPTKVDIVSRIVKKLKPKGYFFISHSESLQNISTDFDLIQPAVYRLKS